jgi:hypothetical protein
MDDERTYAGATGPLGRCFVYTEPIPIRDRPATHVDVVLQYVHHDHTPDELAAKLVYWKKGASGFNRDPQPAIMDT